jgi:hypothetical protein
MASICSIVSSPVIACRSFDTPQCLQWHWQRFVSVNCTTLIKGAGIF